MTPERWQQIKELLDRALTMPTDDRSRFVADMCADDLELQSDVDSLLAHVSGASGFLTSTRSDVVALPPVSLVGQQLGPYTIKSLLGTGGMGQVYLAEDTRLHRLVAVKALHQNSAAGPQGRERLLREARAVAALNAPNIAAIYDILEPASDPSAPPYIVMEYVEGETLSDRVRGGPLPPIEALRITRDIATALAAAHRQGVIHRDLKPANLRLTADGHVKVLDFGLARMLPAAADSDGETIGRNADSRIAHAVAGTPGYMSPEQALGRSPRPPTDIFSLGIVLFQMIAGRRPFAGDDFLSNAVAMMSSPAPRLSGVVPDVPPPVDALVARMLATEPSERPSAADVATEIDRFLRSYTGPRRRWLSYQAGAAAVAVLLAAAGVTWWRTANAPVRNGPIAIAVLPLANLSGDESQAYLGVGIAEALNTSLRRFAGVSVVSRSTLEDAGALKMTAVPKIASSVGATMIVQGSVLQSGDRLRVNANLMSADGKIVWSGDSEAAASDLFAAEARLAGSLIDALRITVSSEDRERMARPPTANRAALEAYWQGLAQFDRSAGDPAYTDRAIRSFETAISLDPGFSLAHAELGNVYRWKSQATNDRALMSQAAAQANEALRIDPNQPEVHMSLANVYRATGRNGSAVEELKRALTQEPTNDNAHRLLGDILSDEGRPEEALVELQRAVALRPQYWRNQQSLGLFDLRRGKLDDAITTLTRVTQLKPDDDMPYQQLGAAYQMRGDKVRARQNYDRSIALNPNPSTYTNLGTILYSEGKYEDAARAYEKAIRLLPKRALYWRNLADTYVKLNRQADAKASYEMAVQLAEEALAVNPSDATTLSQLGVYEAKLGKRVDADRHTSGAVALNPTSSDVLYRRAVVLALNGKPDESLKQLSEAIARGYSRQLAIEDDDLFSLRSLPGFQKTVAPAK